MADMSDPLPGSGVSFWTMAAAAVGSLLTLRTLVDSSPWTRALAVLSSWGLSFFATPGVSEWLGASHKQERIIALLLAIAYIGCGLMYVTPGVLAARPRQRARRLLPLLMAQAGAPGLVRIRYWR